jgi:RHS repeat-associated protein
MFSFRLLFVASMAIAHAHLIADSPNPAEPGPAADSGIFTEPWQTWAKQPIDAPLTLETKALAGAQVTISLAGQNYLLAGSGCGTYTATNRFHGALRPYETFQLTVSGSSWKELIIAFKPYTPLHLLPQAGPNSVPKPYKVYVDGAEMIEGIPLTVSNAACGNYSKTYKVEMRPDRGFRPAFLSAYEENWSRDEDQNGDLSPGEGDWPQIGPGRSTDLASGAFRWSLGMGRLWNGLVAGRIRLNDQQIAARLFNGTALSYTARTTNTAEVHVVVTNANGAIRQIRAPQALLDIQSTYSPVEESVLRFYLRSHVGSTTNSNGLYSILTNTPFVTWRIRNPESPGIYRRFQIVEERPAARTYTSEISYDSTNKVWKLTYGTGAGLKTEQRTVSASGTLRQETVEIRNQSNVNLYKAIERYNRFAWGWELTNVVTNPDSNALTNSFTFHTDSSEPTSYGKLRERWYPGGRWELFLYPYVDANGFDACAGWPTTYPSYASYAQISPSPAQLRIRPISNVAAAPSSSTLQTVTITDTWRAPYGSVGHHISHKVKELAFDIHDDPTVLHWEGVADGDFSQPDVGSWTASDWRWQGEQSNNHETTYRYKRLCTWLHDLVRVHNAKTRETDLFEYQRGTFNLATKAWTTNNAGADLFKLKTTGLSGLFPELIPSVPYYEQILPPDQTQYSLTCVVGKSTQERTYHQSGNPVYQTLSAMTGISGTSPVFKPVESRVRLFDSLGRLTNEVWIDGRNTGVSRVVYEASWKDASGNDSELKSWEINELGEHKTYAYDSQKRLTGITLVGASGQSNVTTNRVFNPAGWLTQETVSGGSLSLNRTQSYDLAGRVTQTKSFDGIVVNVAYSTDARTVTETFPGGTTKITKRYLDGRLESVTGTSVIPEFHQYYIDYGAHQFQTGPSVQRTYYGTNNSPRWIERAKTIMGLPGTERQPAFPATPNELPLEVTRDYYAPASYCHMHVPSSVQKIVSVGGLPTPLTTTHDWDIYGYAVPNTYHNGDGSSQRRTSAEDSRYEFDNTDVWHVHREWWEAANNTIRTNISRHRLTGFSSGNTITDAVLIDPKGNITTVLMTLNRAAKTVTAVTNTPQTTINITGVTVNGLLQSLTSESVSTPSEFFYDSLRRPLYSKDPLGFFSGNRYDPATGWVLASTNASGKVTQMEYYAINQANAGSIKTITAPNLKKTYFQYNNRRQQTRVWGDVPYPEEKIYDSIYGDLTELRTFRAGSSWANSTWPGAASFDKTTWTYEPATRLLLSKTDEAGRKVTNNYHATHTLASVHLARGPVITHTFNAFGDILRKDYSDATPPYVVTGYNALGRPYEISDASGSIALSYYSDGELRTTTFQLGSLAGLAVTNRLHNLYGRDRLQVLNSSGQTMVQQDYAFHSTHGRLNNVTSGLGSVTYAYHPNSDLVQTTTNAYNGVTRLVSTRGWEFGYRLKSFSNAASSGLIFGSNSYIYDSADRRSAASLEDGSYWSFGYNDRDEITSGKRYWPDTTFVPGQQFVYAYDPIGSRTNTFVGGDASGGSLRSATYAANDLNQYSSYTHPSAVDILGVGNAEAAITINAQTTSRKNEYYHRALSVANSSAPVNQSVTGIATLSGSSLTNTGSILVPQTSNAPTYDLDGNLTGDGLWTYAWDAENRLTSIQSTTSVPSAARKRLEFTYDYLGRRIVRKAFNWSGSAYVLASEARFIYDGWNVIAELNASNALQRSYFWGLDLSGDLPGEKQSAGGIGGLLGTRQHTGTASIHFPGYDGNGNVSLLMDGASGSISARYEYGPFGEAIRQTGSYAKTNPFRFSTKFTDNETALVYYGYRYYHPGLGRWVNRDPIEEEGGLNLYAFTANNPVNSFDPLGQSVLSVLPNPGDASNRAAQARMGTTLIQRVQEAVDLFNIAQEFGAAMMDADGENSDAILVMTMMAGASLLSDGLVKKPAVIGHVRDLNPFKQSGNYNWFKEWDNLDSFSRNMQKNVKWIKGIVDRGDDVIIASEKVRPGSITQAEIKLLKKHGYVRQGSRMVKKR